MLALEVLVALAVPVAGQLEVLALEVLVALAVPVALDALLLDAPPEVEVVTAILHEAAAVLWARAASSPSLEEPLQVELQEVEGVEGPLLQAVPVLAALDALDDPEQLVLEAPACL